MCELTEHSPTYPERTVALFNGDDSVIVVDEQCYAIRTWNGREWRWCAWIFREALDILKTLPDNPDDAVSLKLNVEKG